MAQRFHFISGLPRSGSTVLSALLRQNPRFHASISSPVLPLFDGILAQVSAGSELAAMVDQAQRIRLLRGLFDSYYHDSGEKVVFDTNRAWTSKMTALTQVFPDAKVICCVRDVAWVMDSIERQIRSNAFENTRLFASPAERATVYTRLEALAHPNRLVGMPYQALREACWGEDAHRLVLLDYDLLTQRPVDVMRLLYEFLEEEPFTHDFDNIAYDAPEFDSQLGLMGLHMVHKKLEPRPRKTILPPDLVAKFSNMEFWRDMGNSRAFRILSKAGNGAE